MLVSILGLRMLWTDAGVITLALASVAFGAVSYLTVLLSVDKQVYQFGLNLVHRKL